MGGPWPGVLVSTITGAMAPAGEEKDLPMPGTESRRTLDLPGERR